MLGKQLKIETCIAAVEQNSFALMQCSCIFIYSELKEKGRWPKTLRIAF